MSTSNQEKKKKKAFHSWNVARFHLNFPNGNHLSTIWGPGTYSDNYNNRLDYEFALRKVEGKVFDSDTVEIMFTCPPRLEKYIVNKYGHSDQPVGYLPIKKWEQIVHLLATRRTPPNKGSANKNV